MPLGKQLFHRSIAEAVADFLSQKGLSAKQTARRYDIDPATAQNIRKGVLALGTLLKIVRVEGRDLWNRLGDEIYGETLDAYEERRLQQIIDEATDAHEQLVRLRARREALGSRSADAVSALDRPRPHGNGFRHG